jgi:RimJ/RimL family protein N-acetyltransferase
MSQIYGKRIRLRAVEKEDLPLFVRWINDPEVTEDLLFTAPMSMADEEKWFEKMMSLPRSEHVLVIEVQKPHSQGDFGQSEPANFTTSIGVIAPQRLAL